MVSSSTFNSNGIASDLANGLSLAGSGSATISNTVSKYNSNDGFNIHGSVNAVFQYDTAEQNGTDGIGSDGDGFSFHDTTTGVIRNSISKDNLKSAIAQVNTSQVLMENNLFSHDSNGTIAFIYLYGTHTFNNNVVYSGGQIGVGMEGASGDQIISNNIIYGFDNSVYILGGSIIEKNNIVNNHGSEAYFGMTMDSTSFDTDPLFVDSLNGDFTLFPTSPAIDAGTGVSLTTDYAGNSIYGTPDIGAYEYQPPYTFASNQAPTTGSLRLYSDGKYRLTTATSSNNLADFSVTPASGSYLSTTTQYLDLTINSWEISGDKNKSWTATSTAGDFKTHATSTTYTIGDLVPNVNYTFKLDGGASTTAITNNSQCTDGVCMADGTGHISFTYVGGYSTHLFELIKDSTAPAVAISSHASGDSVSGKSVTLTATASDDIGLSTIQIKVDGTSYGSTSATNPYSLTWDSTTVTDGTHIVSAVACDTSNNCATSASVSINVRNNGGVVISLPPGVGTGSSDVSISMNGSGSLGTLNSTGLNVLAYINSVASFTTPVSNSNTNQAHQLTITNLDLAKNSITLLIESTPQTITLNLNETSNIDLNQDSQPDISIKFAGLYVNRAELTVKSLLNNSPLTTTLVTSSTSATTLVPDTSGQVIKINSKARPAVYYVSGGNKYSFVNRGTYTSWSQALGDSTNKFSTLKLITQTEFDKLLFGGNLTIKPGSLVKFTDSSDVYGVGTAAKLYRLADQATQTKLYGNSIPVLLQGINRSSYYDNGNFVAELTGDSVKPE